METKPVKRPLSPHLSIYRPQITSMLSISHRATGVANALGSLLVLAWIWAAAYDATAFEWMQTIASHPVSLVILGLWSFGLYYHLGNGIRHLYWDMGHGFDIPTVTKTGVAVVIFAIAMTAMTWYFILTNMGVIA